MDEPRDFTVRMIVESLDNCGLAITPAHRAKIVALVEEIADAQDEIAASLPSGHTDTDPLEEV